MASQLPHHLIRQLISLSGKQQNYLLITCVLCANEKVTNLIPEMDNLMMTVITYVHVK